MTRQSTVITCPMCGALPGTDCAGDLNHIGRGLALAMERSPYEPVLAHTTTST